MMPDDTTVQCVDGRTRAENVDLFHVHNAAGEMVPLSTVTTVRPGAGPEFTIRFNLYRAAQVNAAAAPGYSSRDVMHALEEVFAETMPREMGFDYAGMSFQESKAQEGVPPAAIFAMSVLFVFLILAALYGSRSACSSARPSRSLVSSWRSGPAVWRTTSTPKSASSC